MNYKGFDSMDWWKSGILAISIGFILSGFELSGMLWVALHAMSTVKNQFISLVIGLTVFTVQVIVQTKGCRQMLYSVMADNMGNVATPCEKAHNKQMLLWIVFADLCIFAISYGVSLGFGNKLFLAIGMPIIGVALFTVMGFAIKRTIQYKRIKRNNEKNERKCQKEDV